MKGIVSLIYRKRRGSSRDLEYIVNIYSKQPHSGKKDGRRNRCGSYQAVLLPTLSVVSFPLTIRRCRM